MKKRLAALAMLSAAALAGCVRYNVPNAGMAYATLGETVQIGGFPVTPLDVLEDSRCAAGTECVWAGRVRISATIGSGAGGQLRELTLGAPVALGRGAVTLARVRPSAREGVKPFPEDYRFGFTFDDN